MTPEQKQNVENLRELDAYHDYSDLCKYIKLLIQIVDEQEATIDGLNQELYGHGVRQYELERIIHAKQK